MTDTRVWHPTDVYPMAADRVSWRLEARNALLVTTYLALFGSVVGIIWHAFAPRVDILPLAVRGSQGAMKPLIGADVWLGGLGLAAAVVCVLTLAVVHRDAMEGPGATVGLAVGGILGMLVAARVGHLLGRHDLYDTLRTIYPHPTAAVDHQLHAYVRTWDLGVRAQGVLLAWPLAAVLLNGIVVAFRRPNQAPPGSWSAYPGSS
ncbi:MAG TPA: hypothetical protein VHA79_08675 [Mycobacteriales bacterium]|jgi:hypothetical protein|nr:hypothetical protein [Mycobacteriales bacterium]HVX69748.1 hypothetical protein [Mycobacteriales bacterium]